MTHGAPCVALYGPGRRGAIDLRRCRGRYGANAVQDGCPHFCPHLWRKDVRPGRETHHMSLTCSDVSTVGEKSVENGCPHPVVGSTGRPAAFRPPWVVDGRWRTVDACEQRVLLHTGARSSTARVHDISTRRQRLWPGRKAVVHRIHRTYDNDESISLCHSAPSTVWIHTRVSSLLHRLERTEPERDASVSRGGWIQRSGTPAPPRESTAFGITPVRMAALASTDRLTDLSAPGDRPRPSMPDAPTRVSGAIGLVLSELATRVGRDCPSLRERLVRERLGDEPECPWAPFVRHGGSPTDMRVTRSRG